jgi:hypothetical protein
VRLSSSSSTAAYHGTPVSMMRATMGATIGGHNITWRSLLVDISAGVMILAKYHVVRAYNSYRYIRIQNIGSRPYIPKTDEISSNKILGCFHQQFF